MPDSKSTRATDERASVTTQTKETVVVAMSGGVDSSVAAGLLLKQGYNVIGVTLLFRPCDDNLKVTWCCGTGAQEQARSVAGSLGIPFYAIDCSKEFEQMVLEPSWRDYAGGRTPSPCILCNEKLKFGYLLDRAKKLGASKIATGHYARIEHLEDGSPVLRRGHYSAKDQTYFLYSLNREQLDATLFPLGTLTKAEVREHARAMGFSNAERPESQDACFVMEEGGFAEALRQRFDAPATEGQIVDRSGAPLKKHAGIHNYTIGQRKGLGVALGKKAYVTAINPDGKVVLSDEPEDLMSTSLQASNINWTGDVAPQFPLSCKAQIRYRHQPAEATVTASGDVLHVHFTEPQKAIAPGQAVVFFADDRVLGGGWIDRR